MNNATIGAAVLGGYLLGRTKKAKAAIGLGALLAGSRVRPGQLGKALDSPFIGNITRQVRTELTDASKAAATSVLTAKADSLAGALHERTAGLRERAEATGEQDQAEDEEEEEEEKKGPPEEDEAEDEDEAEEKEPAEEDEAQDQAEDDEKAGEGRKGRDAKAGAGTSARRSGGRSTAQRSGSTARKSEPRPKKKTAAAIRTKSGTGSRSRRQDDD
ncbi:ABC transporter substrate-binding protein [Streptomyces sp. DSM 40750]|uniref:ABC transporter substrate-binding protein n=1 Tax=Streptomyces sp. DSM 40750 TaxID=2801030 RepID=UPI00214ACB25|nr:ABC transporter substrate-binding protein [Streptomyces sp. DSM 40750]UUU24220.1 ABC transporter substrate-binding protein [Streptomyces sp. DSM 40750]